MVSVFQVSYWLQQRENCQSKESRSVGIGLTAGMAGSGTQWVLQGNHCTISCQLFSLFKNFVPRENIPRRLFLWYQWKISLPVHFSNLEKHCCCVCFYDMYDPGRVHVNSESCYMGVRPRQGEHVPHRQWAPRKGSISRSRWSWLGKAPQEEVWPSRSVITTEFHK